MTTTLHVVLDQLVAPTDPDVAMASRELTAALIRTAPAGCDVAAIAPSGGADVEVAGLASVRRLPLQRRELAAAWQMGITAGVGGGLIHAPTLCAPLIRHDRAHDHDQTVVTIWDLRPWDAPEELPRTSVLWHRAMLKRAEKHADAVVVPTHAMAQRLTETTRLGSRLRVIPGAAPADFAVPMDAVGRRRTIGVPDGVLLLSGDASESAALAVGFRALAGLDLPVVVLDVPEGAESAVAALAAGSGIRTDRLYVRGALDDGDRAAVFDAALVMVAPSRRWGFPWRVVEALTLGVPVVAIGSTDHAEVVLDGGLVVGAVHAPGSSGPAVGDPGSAGGKAGTGSSDATGAAEDADALAAAVADALASSATLDRLAVLAGDRGRAFSWRESADRAWHLHADL
jgi:glycosyltransferase involved in cell wall biosynthesis